MRKKPTHNPLVDSHDKVSHDGAGDVSLVKVVDRRTFVTKGSGLLLAATGAIACSPDRLTGPKGSVHVTLVGCTPTRRTAAE